MKYPLMVSLLASGCLSGFASAAWLRLPTIESEPVNLASSIFVGTQVQSSSGISNPSALLAGSSAEAATIPAGSSEAVISIGEQQIVDQVSLVNDGVAGKLVVSSSRDLKDWTPLAQASFTATDREVPVKFAAQQAKYVRLTFDAGTASSIRNVRISGPASAQSYKEVAVKEAKSVEVNLASTTFGAHPIYVYPTPANFGEVDAQQVFRFPKSTERYRTVVYDLGAVRTIKKFNAAYSRVPTKVQAYAFEQLPEKKDWRGKMTLDAAAFDELKPLATAEDARGDGNVQIVPERPVEAQYVALRFEPNYDKPPVAGLNPDWQGMALAAAIPFAGVARELGLIGGGAFTAAAGESSDDFVVYDAAAGGKLPMVLISRAAIAMVTQQLGPAATEEHAINTILTAAGFAPISNASIGALATGASSKTQVGDPSKASTTDTTGLDALGLSAYRASSGGGGGASPFGPSFGSSSFDTSGTAGSTATGSTSTGVAPAASVSTTTTGTGSSNTTTTTTTPTTTGTQTQNNNTGNENTDIPPTSP